VIFFDEFPWLCTTVPGSFRLSNISGIPGLPASQIIDRICFTKDGMLNDEFKNLYFSLFELASRHIEVVRALANKTKGLTRSEMDLAHGLIFPENLPGEVGADMLLKVFA
jgi:hypothetical protein